MALKISVMMAVNIGKQNEKWRTHPTTVSPIVRDVTSKSLILVLTSSIDVHAIPKYNSRRAALVVDIVPPTPFPFLTALSG